MVLTKENLFMVTSNLLSANSPAYLLSKHNWFDWTQDKWKKRKKTGLVLYGVGEVKPGEGGLRGCGWILLLTKNLCAPLHLPAPPESGTVWAAQANETRGNYSCHFRAQISKCPVREPTNTSTSFPPSPLDVFVKMTLNSKMGKPQKSTLSPQLPLEEELPRSPSHSLEGCEVSEK